MARAAAAKEERPSSEEGERVEEEGDNLEVGSVVVGLPSAKLRICCATADSRPSSVWRRNTSDDGFPSLREGDSGEPPPSRISDEPTEWDEGPNG